MIDYKTISEDILKQINIVEIASHYVKLQKAGRNYTCLCPFHDDKKLGNFYISEEKQIFKCFACGTSGNAIGFVKEIENISYLDALKKVCLITGIKDPRLEASSPKKDTKNNIVFSCLKDINSFYEVSLYQSQKGKEALKYLYSRGLNDEIIKCFGIGYSQENGENIINYLKNKGYSLKDIEKTGISRLDISPMKDQFAGRITFSIKNKDNNVVGFSARIFGDMKSESKYINSRDTEIFKKSTILYNYSNITQEVRKLHYVYLLEGFMDVISLYRIGIKNALAIMGTAFTNEQIQLLRYLNCEVRICLDFDGPGQLNTLRVIKMLEGSGINFKLVNNLNIIGGKDCDEILKNSGGEYLNQILNNLISKNTWILNYYQNSLNLNSEDDRKKIVKNFIPLLASINDPLDYEENKRNLCNLTKFSDKTITELVKRYKSDIKDNSNEILINKRFSNIKLKDKDLTRLQNAEKDVMCYLLDNYEAYSIYKSTLGYLVNPTYRKIVKYIDQFVEELANESDYKCSNLLVYLDSIQEEEKIETSDIKKEIGSLEFEVENLKAPYSKEIFNGIIKTIDEEKKKERYKQQVSENLNSNLSEEEKIKQAKILLEKKNELIKNKKKEK